MTLEREIKRRRYADRLACRVIGVGLAVFVSGCPGPDAPPQPNPTPPKAEPVKEARQADMSGTIRFSATVVPIPSVVS